MSPRIGARRGGGRGGRGARRGQSEEQPAMSAADPNAPAAPVQLSVEAKHLRDFRKYNPKTFDGSMDNLTKTHVVDVHRDYLSVHEVPKRPKVQCAVFFLEDRGTAWWETAERMLGGDDSKITREQFKENFYAKFFSANVKHAKLQKFLNLKQGDMTVKQYDIEFDMLSCFAPDVVRDVAARAEKFVRGLKLDLQGIRVEPWSEEEGGVVVCPGTAARPEVRRYLPAASSGAGCCREDVEGATCLWEVWESSWRLLLVRERGLLQEAKRAGTVVTSTLPILGHYAFVLFDSGSSHSFISSVFVQHVGLEVEPLDSVLFVSTPPEEVLLSKEKIKACRVEIANHMLDVTLLVLDNQDFDV
ncbi:ty3-gypsy retrotransposon protein [Cucumis melo var. makuwa]|uniref:Ty3-gypsy retrotransposon protein n=1 Tax=Cucumis melo var. makuwa TaxID=1194695 RepID=A0A5D3BG36_CUCMM|nr:ty3-gypsy retrotransposon protein [Cucumis melo var. makuwa]